MLVMSVSKHNPEACPAIEPKFRGAYIEAFEKHESLAAKHKVKIVGSWVNPASHTTFIVYDTPSMDNLMSLTAEPAMMGAMTFQTSVMKPLVPVKDVLAMIKNAK
jgi:hypothetical protein